MAVVTRLVCAGCGFEPPASDPAPFRCPRAAPGDDVDHVVLRVLDGEAFRAAYDADAIFRRNDDNPFIRYRELFHAYHRARGAGFPDAEVVRLVRDLDAAVVGVDGRGFRVTPFVPDEILRRGLGAGAPRALWIKQETGNVSGSHKGRHLMGVLLWLELGARSGFGGVARETPLAIASCGNAALAAAVVARAAGRPLSVFVPPHADPRVVSALSGHGAAIRSCPRVPGEAGDPCVLRFREELSQGALPFSIQGNANGLSVEGGETLGYEMVSQLLAAGRALDAVFVQVGGGALASAVWLAFHEALDLGLISRLPRLYTVQTEGAWPLFRAYARLAARIVARRSGERGVRSPAPLAHPDPVAARDVAAWIQAHVPPAEIAEEVRYACTHRHEFMWPWEEEPRSIAGGILDDETYDWAAVVEGMLLSGGAPLVVSEDTLARANGLARGAGYPVDATGSAGLAGALALAAAGGVSAEEEIAVLLTGVLR